uniref:Uncharacterized protein n=1 Tax=Anguilla anguilla TaxID=7936 RepID=A0A0E9PZV9_ANGAN
MCKNVGCKYVLAVDYNDGTYKLVHLTSACPF